MKRIHVNTLAHKALVILLMSFFGKGSAQDIHFSQFFQAPLRVNPGLTGVFNGDQRAYFQYRDQWKEFSPYKTYSFSLDAGLMKKKLKDKYIGAGLYIFQDLSGEPMMKTTQAHLSISSIIEINKEQIISAGIQGGMGQNSLDESNMQWGTNYDGAGYNPAPSGEEGQFEAYMFGDFSAGLSWNYSSSQSNISKNNHFSATAGLAVFHINTPNQGEFGEELNREFVAHASANIGLAGTPLSLLPSVVLLQQGSLNELISGALLRYMIKEESKYTGFLKETSASMGVYYRKGDAVIPTFLLEYGSYALGISYDINVSNLKEASNGNGGIEISLRFVNPNPFIYGKGSRYQNRGLL